MIGFIIWFIIGCVFIGWGIYLLIFSKDTAAGFWANAEVFPVENIKAYNRACGKLWCAYGIVFLILGIPLLEGQKSMVALITMLGVMLETITVMVIYVTVIEKKYRKK